jgi:hypothetical protein
MQQLTPTQERLLEERVARLERMAGNVVLDTPLQCLSASERASAWVPSIAWKPPAPIEKPAPQPLFSFSTWLARQEALHPLPHDFLCELKRLVKGHIGRDNCPRIEYVQKVVASFFGVRMLDMRSARRTADVVRPRQIAMYLCKMMTLHSLPEIGRRFGGRDHTTVLHAIRKYDALIAKNEVVATQIESLRATIMGMMAPVEIEASQAELTEAIT